MPAWASSDSIVPESSTDLLGGATDTIDFRSAAAILIAANHVRPPIGGPDVARHNAESMAADYRMATATPLAAFAMSEATAFGCDT